MDENKEKAYLEGLEFLLKEGPKVVVEITRATEDIKDEKVYTTVMASAIDCWAAEHNTNAVELALDIAKSINHVNNMEIPDVLSDLFDAEDDEEEEE